MSTTRNQTNPDAPPDWTLSQQQRTAIDLLVTGHTLQAVADAMGVLWFDRIRGGLAPHKMAPST